MRQELFECWVMNGTDLSLVSTALLTSTVSLLFQKRARKQFLSFLDKVSHFKLYLRKGKGTV